MTKLSSDLVQSLARWKGEAPVVSLYLDLIGRSTLNPDECRQRFESMAKSAKVEGDAEKAAIEKLREFMQGDFVEPGAAAVAVFAGSDLWEVVNLPVAVGDSLVVNHSPIIRPLERALDENEPIGVLLADRQHARMLVVGIAGVEARNEIEDPLPRHDDDGGDWEKDRVKTHSAASASAHLKRSAREMFEFSKSHSFGRLVISAPDDIRNELERHLHAYLKAKIVGRVSLEVRATHEKVCDTARSCAATAERDDERQAVERLRSGHHAVSGLDAVLDALYERRVETLLVSDGYVVEGWRCGSCSKIASLGPKCPKCGETLNKVHDVVEEAVEDALSQKCKVDFCLDNADLDVAGRIGALLRF